MKKYFLLLLSFLLISFIPLVHANDLPSGVNPQKGTATTIVDFEGGKVIYSVSFWNVGKLGGNNFAKATITIGCKEAAEGATCVPPTTMDGEFTGGPNGTLGEGEKAVPLVNGSYFDMPSGMGNNVHISVENPEIFDGWKNPQENKFEDSGAGFSDLAGQVEVNIPNPDGTYDEENWTSAKLKQGQTFPVGTHIKTFEKSTAIITYSDASSFKLQPESEIILSSSSERKGNLELIAGNMWANIKKMAKDGSMQVEMSQAVAGIKGTRFILTENKKESKLEVTEGTVEFTHKKTKEKITVSSGESVIATSEDFNSKTKFDPSSLDKEILNQESKSTILPIQTQYIGIFVIVLIITSAVIFFIKRKK
jgi:hypothetical protein